MARKVEISDDEDKDFPDVADLVEDIKIARLMELSEKRTTDKTYEIKKQQSKLLRHLTNDATKIKFPCTINEKKSEESSYYFSPEMNSKNFQASERRSPSHAPDRERQVTKVEREVSSSSVRQRSRRKKETAHKACDGPDVGAENTDSSDFVDIDFSSNEGSEVEAALAHLNRRRARVIELSSSNNPQVQDLHLEEMLPQDCADEESEAPNTVKDKRSTMAMDAQDKNSSSGYIFRATLAGSDGLETQFKRLNISNQTESSQTDAFQRQQLDQCSFGKDDVIILLDTPPGTPLLKLTKLSSPKKKIARIPTIPHRPSMDLFWQQDVINQWNDEYSPMKKVATASKLLGGNSGLPKKEALKSPKKTLAKQSVTFKAAKKLFSEKKQSIAENFLRELDEKITKGEISRLTASTGGVKIVWSKKLNSTAGRANWRREAVRSSNSIPLGSSSYSGYKHHATIELAEKVIDDDDRLLNVLAHEFCHLANFMISNIRNNPHGKEFKSWAAKCSSQFGHRGIQVTTRHSYVIDYKYTWECESCSLEVKRHSKSVDPQKHRCGKCMGRLKQTKPLPRGADKTCEYQQFVRENTKKIRQENPESPQKEILVLVGRKYKEFKALRSREEMDQRDGGGLCVNKNKIDEDEVESVTRKLSYFDLTSP